MTGKAGSLRGEKRYRNYWCSRATRSRALCSHYNGHSTIKLESAVLEYLGQFSDPEAVRLYVEATDREELSRKKSELKGIELNLEELEFQFTQNLGFLRREVLNEQEFIKSNNLAREQVSVLQARKVELSSWIEKQVGRIEATELIPGRINNFLQDLHNMEPRIQKGHLQGVLKSAYVTRDKIELEFRV